MRASIFIALTSFAITACAEPLASPGDAGPRDASVGLDGAADTGVSDAATRDARTGDGGAPPDLDGGGGGDAGARDGGPIDASGEGDGGDRDASARDASVRDASDRDASARDAAPTACDPQLGAPCEDSCSAGFTCTIGRCTPQGREVCGGVVGAPCADRGHPHCLYFASADFGVCLDDAEVDCLCRVAPASFPECTSSR